MFTICFKSSFIFIIKEFQKEVSGSNFLTACSFAGDTADSDLIPGSRRSLRVGNVNPLHYSCLENPMDRGAWWATVHGVAKSLTSLSTHGCAPKIVQILSAGTALWLCEFFPFPISSQDTSTLICLLPWPEGIPQSSDKGLPCYGWWWALPVVVRLVGFVSWSVRLPKLAGLKYYWHTAIGHLSF